MNIIYSSEVYSFNRQTNVWHWTKFLMCLKTLIKGTHKHNSLAVSYLGLARSALRVEHLFCEYFSVNLLHTHGKINGAE